MTGTYPPAGRGNLGQQRHLDRMAAGGGTVPC